MQYWANYIETSAHFNLCKEKTSKNVVNWSTRHLSETKWVYCNGWSSLFVFYSCFFYLVFPSEMIRINHYRKTLWLERDVTNMTNRQPKTIKADRPIVEPPMVIVKSWQSAVYIYLWTKLALWWCLICMPLVKLSVNRLDIWSEYVSSFRWWSCLAPL